MAINLASKYSDQIAEVFTRASFIKGKTAETYDKESRSTFWSN